MTDLFSETSDTSYQSDIEYLSNSKIFDISNGSPLNNENLNLLHYNINSITAEGRLDELSYICKLLNIAVLVITESKLDHTIPNNIICIDGYHEPIRRDRLVNGRDGGGTLMYISDTLAYVQKSELQSDCFEHLWVDIKLKSKTFSINALYRPPKSENHDIFLHESESILTKLANYKADNKIILSDITPNILGHF